MPSSEEACPSCEKLRALPTREEFEAATAVPDNGEREMFGPGMAIVLGVDPVCGSSCGFVLYDLDAEAA